jgi:hypothetical protein
MRRRSRNKLREITRPLKPYYCAYADAKGNAVTTPKRVPAATAEHAARLFDQGQGRNQELTVLVWTAEMLERGKEPYRHYLNSRGSAASEDARLSR